MVLRSWRRLLLGLLVFIVAWEVVAWVAARALVVDADLSSADAIVVLSGSSAYVERTHKAAELYREGRAPLVWLTDDHTRGGWSSALQRNPYFVERATDELIKSGVPAERIRIVPGVASSTRDESLIVRDYASSQGVRSVLVVTSAYHSRRALRTLRQVFAGTGTTIGLQAVAATSNAWWWLQPNGWRDVAGEYVKLIYYWFKYV
ncbi:MAG TPA: YdcF family protein [Pyrinomonadaceae bacterium]|nr:YdcF family protein [Pyrinomonadaceae bacterium]